MNVNVPLPPKLVFDSTPEGGVFTNSGIEFKIVCTIILKIFAQNRGSIFVYFTNCRLNAIKLCYNNNKLGLNSTQIIGI